MPAEPVPVQLVDLITPKVVNTCEATSNSADFPSDFFVSSKTLLDPKMQSDASQHAGVAHAVEII